MSNLVFEQMNNGQVLTGGSVCGIMANMKKYLCSICKEYLPQGMFYPDRSRSTGVSSRCIACKILWEKSRIRNRKAYFKQYRQDNAVQIKVKWKVAYAIKTGKLKKQNCEVCGNNAESHHEDYSKPLEVRWLCHKHHMERHRKLTFG